MGRKELRHDRHTVSLLTDHMVFSPKYHGKILVGDVALALDGIIWKTCKDLNIEIIDMAVNVDHIHLFVKYPPKYSVSYIAKRIQGRSSRELPESISTPQGMVRVLVSGHHLDSMVRLVMGGRLWRGAHKIRRSRMLKRDVQALDLSPGFSDCEFLTQTRSLLKGRSRYRHRT